jgi:hypothetical protein
VSIIYVACDEARFVVRAVFVLRGRSEGWVRTLFKTLIVLSIWRASSAQWAFLQMKDTLVMISGVEGAHTLRPSDVIE